jgi:predicted nuclease of restriction endonuclease-like (RecB) superfamily
MAILKVSENTETPDFFIRVANIIEQARNFVGRTADLSMTVTYFEVGRMIVEKEQGGQERAEYGQNLMKKLSEFLTDKFKKGFSLSNLKNAKQFYNTYKIKVSQTLYSQLPDEQKSQTPSGFLPQVPQTQIQQAFSAEIHDYETMKQAAQFFKLGWSHYTFLMGIENEDERRFYEIESERENWSYRHLKRQYHSSLYERLALSKDKNEVIRLSREGQIVEKPRDILKNPLVLEFLGMAEAVTYSETELETVIISKLQAFLLELGKGFLFEARQKRFTYDGQSFFVDLIFYNRLLQCYVLIDLKNDELKHQDLGQMQMYVNYFDRYVKQNFEKPSIGILLCKKKSDSIVELTLPQDAQIYASEYSLYLPDKAVLQRKLAEWIQEFEDEHGDCCYKLTD